jgi:hypothetical protein
MPGAHKCIVCGRKLSEDTSRHYFKDTWPADVRAAIARRAHHGEAKNNVVVCCSHFDEPLHRNFSKNNPPKLSLELDGAEWKTPPKRRRLSYADEKKCESDARVTEKLAAANVEIERLNVIISESIVIPARLRWCMFQFSEENHYNALRAELAPHMPEFKSNFAKCSPQTLFDTFFLFLRNGMSAEQVAAMTGCDARSASRRFESSITSLLVWAKPKIELLELDEWKEDSKKMLDSDYAACYVLFVDGTTLRVRRPGDSKLYREMFGAKNGAIAWTFFIVVTPRGRIVYVSDVDGASNTDGTQWKKCGCCEALVAKYGSDSKFIIGGDKGYVHASPPAGWQLVLTKTADMNDEPDPEADEEADGRQIAPKYVSDASIAKYRAVVERTFARVKHWKGLKNPFLVNAGGKCKKMIDVVCAIVNWEILSRNIEQV